MAEKKYTFIDGGIFAYNPALVAYIQAKEMYPHAENFFLLSLGTGLVTLPHSEEQLHDSSDKNWAHLLADIAFAAHSDMVNYQVEDIFKSKTHSRYVRLQPSLQGLNKEIDNVSQENLQLLHSAAKDFIKTNEKTLSETVEALCSGY